MGTRGRVRLAASRQTRMGCTIWEATRGNGVRIGTIRRTLSACCAVRRGTITTRIVCWPLTAALTRPIVAALTPVFVVLSLGILRGRAGRLVRNPTNSEDFPRSGRPKFAAALLYEPQT